MKIYGIRKIEDIEMPAGYLLPDVFFSKDVAADFCDDIADSYIRKYNYNEYSKEWVGDVLRLIESDGEYDCVAMIFKIVSLNIHD